MIASTPYQYNNYTGQTTQNFIISLAHEIIIIFMGINNQSRSQRPTKPKWESLIIISVFTDRTDTRPTH